MRIHTFGTGQDLPVEDAVARLGRKGAGLLEMARLGIPVPPGFTLPTEACLAYFAHGDAALEAVTRGSRTSNGCAASASATPTGRCWSRYGPVRPSRCRG